jgi:hypothetical protein
MNHLPYLPQYCSTESRKTFVENELRFVAAPTKITLIKILRYMTDSGLKEAKDSVETVPEFTRVFVYQKNSEFMAKVAEFFAYNEKAKRDTLLSANVKRGTVARWSDMPNPIVVDYADNLSVWVWENGRRGAIERAQWDYNVNWESLVPF